MQMIWVTITGAKQGKFTSDITRKGFEGKIDVLAYNDSISVPTDGASGLPTGRRQHSPISITKHIDKTSPLLANAAYTNENLSSVKFEFVRPTPTLGGTVGEKVFFTIELTNSNIISLTRSMTGDHWSSLKRRVTFSYPKSRGRTSTQSSKSWKPSPSRKAKWKVMRILHLRRIRKALSR